MGRNRGILLIKAQKFPAFEPEMNAVKVTPGFKFRELQWEA